MSSARLSFLAQLLGTLLILVAIPSTLAKAILLLAWWLLTFAPLRRAELVFFALACTLFTIMNALALRQGIFTFADCDILRMPYFELGMWGFYGLHMWRLLGGPVPDGSSWIARLLVIPFALCFALVAEPSLLLVTSGIACALALLFFHEPWDLAYVAYAVALGALIEYTGVWTGQWSYPGPPPGGVPLWFITLWGGVGLFLRRLFVPLLARSAPSSLLPQRLQPVQS